MRKQTCFTISILLFSLVLVQAALAQGLLAESKDPAKASDAVSSAAKPKAESTTEKSTGAAPVVVVKKPAQPAPGLFSRWVEVQTATITTRYRAIEDSKDVLTTNQVQTQEAFKGRFKFDKKGDYSINAGVFSGNGFTSSWNNTGIGTGTLFTNLYLKQLYFAAKPVKGLELQYGGLYVIRGESTEVTTYDNDSYLMGQRLTLKRPKEMFFDEISVTYAYLGDTGRSNINKRFNRLQKSNYHQFLVGKGLGKWAAVSVDYTFVSGVDTMREAFKVNTKWSRFIDSVRVENYQRGGPKSANGFAFTADKALHKRISVGGGYANIDLYYGGLNADRFNKGNRLFVTSSFTISPEFTVTTFWQHSVDTDFAISNKQRLDIHFTYNFLKTLQRAHLF